MAPAQEIAATCMTIRQGSEFFFKLEVACALRIAGSKLGYTALVTAKNGSKAFRLRLCVSLSLFSLR